MANPHLSTTLDSFAANVHRTKNRLIAIPAATQRRLGLLRQAHNHIVLFSVRLQGKGRWNHHLAYLTSDNEFAIPSDVTGIKGGDRVDVKIHRVIPDADALNGPEVAATAGGVLLRLAEQAGEDDRTAGSTQVDDILYGNERG
ncbi:MAG TPA: hypothetical protein VHH90_05530 [Polyangia bacterium]|nr:hypothetical protein [Polyangia bacterium]